MTSSVRKSYSDIIIIRLHRGGPVHPAHHHLAGEVHRGHPAPPPLVRPHLLAAGVVAVPEVAEPAAAGKNKFSDFDHCLLSRLGIFLHYEF